MASDNLGRPADVYQTVTDSIIRELEQGTAPWVRPWTAKGKDTSLPHNACSLRPYNGSNVILLWMSAAARGYSSNAWLTFQQAKEAGGFVRKGEKATLVTFAKSYEKEDDEGNTRRISVLRAFFVFNRDQCDGLPSPKTVPVPPQPELDATATAFLARIGADIRHGGTRAFYSPTGDFISLPHSGDFRSGHDYIATSLHEHVHWTGSDKRLARIFGKRFGDHAYEELVAELGAAFLCARLSITGQLQHASYINNWLAALKHDRKFFFAAASAATKAAEFIIAKAEPETVALPMAAD